MTTVERLRSGKDSLVIIILLMLHSWWGSSLRFPTAPPPPPRPCLHFHISLSSSVSSHRLILSLWGADKNRGRGMRRDKEKAKDDKKKLETDRERQKDLSEGRGVPFLSQLEAFVIIGLCLYGAKHFGQLILRENNIPFYLPLFLHLVCKCTKSLCSSLLWDYSVPIVSQL